MNLEAYHRVYFLGIGGIGMSALARWFHEAGFKVAGYDRTATDMTSQLMAQGIAISFEDELENIPQDYVDANGTLVVYTPAIPENHKGFNYFSDKGFTLIKRAKALGLIVSSKFGIAVAGTHGKTSVSTMVAAIFNEWEEGCNAFLGGVAKNFSSNVLIKPDSKIAVVEADEFDRSFLTLYPNMAIITSMDADHLDIYDGKEDLIKTFEEFITQVKPGGSVILKKNLAFNKALNTEVSYYSYALNEEADFYASNLNIDKGYYVFDMHHPDGKIQNIKLGVPGLYNVDNAVAAIASALLCKVSEASIKSAMVNYQGVKRRFDVQLRSTEIVFIDDYAHHPEEIKACLNSVRHLYPGKKLTAIFQPHLYTRTRDFVKEFATSLDGFDEVILTDLYPAREKAIEGISSRSIYDLMQLTERELWDYHTVVENVKHIKTDVLITMGAGDIDKLVLPIKQELEKRLA